MEIVDVLNYNYTARVFLYICALLLCVLIIHRVRFLMIKFYLKHGYTFDLPRYFGIGKALRKYGLADLGCSENPNAKFPITFIFDGLYVAMYYLTPYYIITCLYSYLHLRLQIEWVLMIIFGYIGLTIFLNIRRYNFYTNSVPEYKY